MLGRARHSRRAMRQWAQNGTGIVTRRRPVATVFGAPIYQGCDDPRFFEGLVISP
jgi:hypothetical protein